MFIVVFFFVHINLARKFPKVSLGSQEILNKITLCKLIRCRHVFDLYSRLCRMKIGTNAVENNCSRLCRGFPRSREREMLVRVMKWKLADARKCLSKTKWENTREWRKPKTKLRGTLLPI